MHKATKALRRMRFLIRCRLVWIALFSKVREEPRVFNFGSFPLDFISFIVLIEDTSTVFINLNTPVIGEGYIECEVLDALAIRTLLRITHRNTTDNNILTIQRRDDHNVCTRKSSKVPCLAPGAERSNLTHTQVLRILNTHNTLPFTRTGLLSTPNKHTPYHVLIPSTQLLRLLFLHAHVHLLAFLLFITFTTILTISRIHFQQLEFLKCRGDVEEVVCPMGIYCYIRVFKPPSHHLIHSTGRTHFPLDTTLAILVSARVQ